MMGEITVLDLLVFTGAGFAFGVMAGHMLGKRRSRNPFDSYVEARRRAEIRRMRRNG